MIGWMVAGAVGLPWMVGGMVPENKLVLAHNGCRSDGRIPDQSRCHSHRRQGRDARSTDH